MQHVNTATHKSHFEETANTEWKRYFTAATEFQRNKFYADFT